MTTETVIACQCGCGLPAPIAKETNRPTGRIAGQPLRFRRGHNTRLRGVKDDGYVALFKPDHPSADKHGRVMEHIFIAETAIGHVLPPGAEVHHVDENRQHNANRNLIICQDRTYHQLLHVRARILKAGGDPNTQKVCSGCHQPRDLDDFTRETRNKSTGRMSYCRACIKARAEQ